MTEIKSLTLSPAAAAKILNEEGFPISAEKIRFGLQQGVYPFGDAVKMASEYSYAVYSALLTRWIAERTGAHEMSES